MSKASRLKPSLPHHKDRSAGAFLLLEKEVIPSSVCRTGNWEFSVSPSPRVRRDHAAGLARVNHAEIAQLSGVQFGWRCFL